MNKLKNIALGIALSTLTTTLPYITYSAQALPINDLKEKEIKEPIDIFNIENKNIKRNQKEEMAEILVNLYNKYNEILKKGLEKNDIENSSLYFNITKQKAEIKELLNKIINYPYSVVNSEIEQKFLKSNVLFCYLNNQYIKTENLDNILNDTDINNVKIKLKSIVETLDYSMLSLENSLGNYSNVALNNKVSYLNNTIEKIKGFESLNSKINIINETLNDIYSHINLILEEYIINI